MREPLYGSGLRIDHLSLFGLAHSLWKSLFSPLSIPPLTGRQLGCPPPSRRLPTSPLDGYLSSSSMATSSRRLPPPLDAYLLRRLPTPLSTPACSTPAYPPLSTATSPPSSTATSPVSKPTSPSRRLPPPPLSTPTLHLRVALNARHGSATLGLPFPPTQLPSIALTAPGGEGEGGGRREKGQRGDDVTTRSSPPP